MLNILYGWYLKNELSCVFDTITFEVTMIANAPKELILEKDAEFGDLKKNKLGTFNFIITRIFSLSGGKALQAIVQPDGDDLQGFVSILYKPRVVEPDTPLLLTMDLKLQVDADTVNTKIFIVFEGFWIPKSLMSQFNDLVDAVVTSPAKAAGVSMPSYSSRIMTERGGNMGREGKVPYCKPRRFE